MLQKLFYARPFGGKSEKRGLEHCHLAACEFSDKHNSNPEMVRSETGPKHLDDIPKNFIDLCERIDADAINPKLANYYFAVMRVAKVQRRVCFGYISYWKTKARFHM